MINNILISVIIPCYNSEKYIKRCLVSLANQNFDNWEAIIVNDGSTDNTLSIVKSFLNNNHFKLFSKTNGGYVSAINYGLNNINGKYVMMLGSDDEIYDNFFENLYRKIKNNNYDFIFFKTIIAKENKHYYDPDTNFKKDFIYKKQTLLEIEKDNYALGYTVTHRDTSRLYKTKLINDLKYSGRIGYDSDGIFSTIYSHRVHSYAFFNLKGYLWNKRSDSLGSFNNVNKYSEDRLVVWNYFFNEAMKKFHYKDISHHEKKFLIKYLKLIYRCILERNNTSLIRKSIRTAEFFLKYVGMYENSSKTLKIFLKFPFLSLKIFSNKYKNYFALLNLNRL